MRVLIVGPPKTGNAHLRCILAAAYGLRSINGRDAPGESSADGVPAWLAELPAKSVGTASFRFHEQLVSAATAQEVTLVAVIRHPYDLFISNIDVAHQRARRANSRARSADRSSAIEPPGDSDDVPLPAIEGFSREIASLLDWQESGWPIVRFENLERDPAAVLTTLSRSLGTLSQDQIARAVSVCPSESVIRSRPERGTRMPALPAGAWRHRLPVSTLRLLNERYADAVRRLGYDDI